ncbi:MAG: glycerol-3-phosphate 1-O-acyltransferase PlsY [Elusimicrobiota bacterium]|nr:glycerol-3-phosphate 1-O-acyltransferase PlsY [Elusimicrobiota bacterium]
MNFLVVIYMSYLIGSIPTAYIITKILKGIDIRSYGSGNPGATNVLRLAGKTAGIFTFVIDFLKGFLTVKLAGLFGWNPEIQILCGTAAIIGHNWTVWLKFRGGKGVATGAGVVFALLHQIAIISIGVFIITVLLTGYVSVGSIVSAISVSLFSWLNLSNTKISLITKIVITVLSAIVIFKHKDNIKRLTVGKESKFQL